jgi:hypothetical protein
MLTLIGPWFLHADVDWNLVLDVKSNLDMDSCMLKWIRNFDSRMLTVLETWFLFEKVHSDMASCMLKLIWTVIPTCQRWSELDLCMIKSIRTWTPSCYSWCWPWFLHANVDWNLIRAWASWWHRLLHAKLDSDLDSYMLKLVRTLIPILSSWFGTWFLHAKVDSVLIPAWKWMELESCML